MLVHEGHASARRFFTPANASSYDSIVRITTFGRDSAWKRQILNIVGVQDSVLELACGTGVLSSMLGKTADEVVGLDLTFEYLLAAKNKLQLPLAQGTAEMLPYTDASFSAVVSSYLAKYVDIPAVVQECERVLEPGGVVLFHDFIYPRNSAMRYLWNSYFSMLRLAGRFASFWRTVFEELDRVIRNSSWVEQTENALYKKGFQEVTCRYYTLGTSAIVSARKP